VLAETIEPAAQLRFVGHPITRMDSLLEEDTVPHQCNPRDQSTFLISKKPQPTEEQAHVVSHPTASM
jgi:hypothetical protein